MLTRSQADSLSKVSYGGKQKKLKPQPREKGLPIDKTGLRSAAAKKLQKREVYP